MGTRELQAELFGRTTSFTYSERWIGYSLLSLRLVMGWTLFYAGITKVLDPDWSAEGFLRFGIPDGNPFTSLWTMMANDWVWLLTPLNQWGLTLCGAAIILGAFVRWSSFWAAVMMLFYWLAAFPMENSFIIDDHLVYAFLFFGLGAFGAGRILGVDEYLERTQIVKNNPWLRYFLG